MQRFFRAHQLHEKPYRILAMSDSVLTNTGYATATRDIMNTNVSSEILIDMGLFYLLPHRCLGH